MPILQTKALKKYYGTKDTEVRALDGVDLSVEVGEFVSIVGTSSPENLHCYTCGRSGPSHFRSGLCRWSGYLFAQRRCPDNFRRRKIGFVFQSYNLVPVLNVLKISYFPLSLTETRLTKPISSKSQKCSVLTAMHNRLPNQLSGGQQQRVAIAGPRHEACHYFGR